jgi:hypothetical protein
MKQPGSLHKNYFFTGTMFLKKYVALSFFFIFSTYSFAVLSYTESNLSVAFVYNVAPMTPIGALCGLCDESFSGPNPIGFTFNYGGTNYTQFIVSINGFLTFNMGCAGSDPNNQLAGNATQTANLERPIIAPLWDDLDVWPVAGNGGSYKLTGGAGTHVLTVEWRGMMWKSTATNSVISFQVKLYEGTNIIDFCYKRESVAPLATVSASIGLEGQSGVDYYSLTNTSATPGVAHNSGEVTTLNVWPATNQVYRWTNNTTLPVQLLSFNGVSYGSANELHWTTACEINNDYFTIERSDNGSSFEKLATVAGAGNCSHASTYQASDNSPYKITYYRLKQTDFNGDFTYSKIIALSANNKPTFRIHPNPSNNFIFIEDPPNGEGTYEIIASSGVKINQGTMDNTHSIDVGLLPEGVYMLVFKNGISQRFIVYH